MSNLEEGANLNVVVFAGDDPEDARNWPESKKNLVIFLTAVLSFVAGFGSPIFAPEELQLIQKFHINEVTADAGLAFFVLGFSFGPIFWGPMSEMYGRRVPYRISWVLLIGCSAVTAFVNNIPVIIIFRLFSGCVAGCAQNNPLGYYSDLYEIDNVKGRKKAMAAYSLAFCSGPMFAIPIGFLVLAHTGGHDWVLRVYFFMAVALLPAVFMLPESHGPSILAARAKVLRRAGVHNARAAHELQNRSMKKILSQDVVRPFGMLVFEPIAFGSAVWLTLASALVYLYFEIFPLLFLEKHNFAVANAGLPFFALLAGVPLAVVLVGILSKNLLPKRIPFFQPDNADPNGPESHLKISIIACILMPISLFWLAWSSGSNVHWIVPILSGVPLASSILLIMLSFVTYISHTYTIYSNSANACNAFVRSFGSFALAISSHKIISSLGFNWGVSLFGFLSFGLLPIPLIFLRYGEQLRNRSYYAKEAARVIAEMNKSSRNPAQLDHLLPGSEGKQKELEGRSVESL